MKIINFFFEKSRIDLDHSWSDKVFQGTVWNYIYHFINWGSLETTRTVPLILFKQEALNIRTFAHRKTLNNLYVLLAEIIKFWTKKISIFEKNSANLVHPFGKLQLSNKYIYNYIYTREELFNIDYSLELSYPHLSWVTFSLVKEDTIMREVEQQGHRLGTH